MTMGMAMSGFDEGEAGRIRARQDKQARAEARRAKMERQSAREAAALEQQLAAQRRIVEEAKAAREAGLMEEPARPALCGSAVREPHGGDVSAVARRLEAKAARDEADQVQAKARAKERKRIAASGVGPKVEIGFKEVKNPYDPAETMTVAVNLAEHPLEMMLARGRLDQPLYEAGVRFRMIYERAAIGPGRGIDPAKIKVDGGRMGDPLSDSVVHAQFELARLARELGMVGERIVSRVAGHGVTVSDLAKQWPGPEDVRTKRDYLTMRLKEALDLLASEVWGARGRDHGTIVGERGMGSGMIDERAVEVANQRYLGKRGLSL
jgi:hypothetical protein